jgi:hypothetical protein
MFKAVVLFIALIVAQVSAYASFKASGYIKNTQLNVIPPFSFPGSIIPPSPLEAIFSGSAKPASKPFNTAVPFKVTTGPAKKASTKGKTINGRPDPSPELFVDNSGTFSSAPWRYNSK